MALSSRRSVSAWSAAILSDQASKAAKPLSSRQIRRSSSQKQRSVDALQEGAVVADDQGGGAAGAPASPPASRWRRCRGGWSARPAAARPAARRRRGPAPRAASRRRTGPGGPRRGRGRRPAAPPRPRARRAAGRGVVEQASRRRSPAPAPRSAMRAAGVSVRSPPSGSIRPGQHAQQGRLAGAVAADQAGAHARLQRQVDAVEQHAAARRPGARPSGRSGARGRSGDRLRGWPRGASRSAAGRRRRRPGAASWPKVRRQPVDRSRRGRRRRGRRRVGAASLPVLELAGGRSRPASRRSRAPAGPGGPTIMTRRQISRRQLAAGDVVHRPRRRRCRPRRRRPSRA